MKTWRFVGGISDLVASAIAALSLHFRGMSPCLPVLSIGLLALPTPPLRAQVLITEFMAGNPRSLKDDFGQYSDWIELFNAGSSAVNLQDWGLTDNGGDLFKWRFPGTNLPPKSFLVAYASGRDRRLPGQSLHVNFKLDTAGEYLALTRPDGSIANQFAPAFPPQFDDVSYGYGIGNGGILLVKTNAPCLVRTPLDDSLGVRWRSLEFDDSDWRATPGGIGFESGLSDDPGDLPSSILADHPAGYWQFNKDDEAAALNSGWLASMADGQYPVATISRAPGPGAPDFTGFEPGNQAVRLDGRGGRVEAPYRPELNPGGPFTVEAWAKPSKSGGSTAWPVSSMNIGSGRSGYALAQDYSTKNQWEFRLGDGQGYIAMAVGGKVDTNRWQYLAGVYDGTSARLYVNGILAASAALARPFEPNTAQKLVIGGRIDASNPYYYAGDLDEVSVIDRALPDKEIAARFQRALKSAAPAGDIPYRDLVTADLENEMAGMNSSVYLRVPFAITNALWGDRLVLRVKYDDGFAAFINGSLAASANAPGSLDWNSAATARHPALAALQFEEHDISGQIGSLRDGANMLAIQGLNLAATNTDFLLLAELEYARQEGIFEPSRYFLQPTPGTLNGGGAKDLGPIVGMAGHMPPVPGTNDSITVTCRVHQAFAPVSEVSLRWRTMFNNLGQISMLDDGRHGDGAAGDGVYGAVIPCQDGLNRNYTAGQMVRWYVTASDSLARTSRWPLFENPSGSAEYLGTVIQPDVVSSKLPVFHLFAPPSILQPGPATAQTGADSESGGRVALYYDGEFYDNIYMELRGNTSAGLNKKAHRMEFNASQPFRHPGSGQRSLKSSLLAEHLDPAYLRQHLCFWLLNNLGVPSPYDYPVRLQLNGVFYQLAFHNEVLGAEQLDRLGYSASGALYKCAGVVNAQFSSTAGFQKILPKTNLTSRVDYLTLANGISETKPANSRKNAVFDLLDVPEVVNYLAGARFCSENDDVWANMSLYCDTYGDGLWRIVPYDMNASWGQLFGGSSPLQATNDASKSHPLYGGSQVKDVANSSWNRLYDVIIALPETRAMLLRRERTLLDRWVLPPGTAAENLILENYIKLTTNRIGAEAVLDRQKWGSSPWAAGKSFAAGIADLLTQFAGPRRTHWYKTHSVTNTAKPTGLGNSYNAGIPLAQAPQPAISFFDCDYNPSSGNQDEEYVCLTNANSFAVDVSGWRLDGGVRHTLQQGTVIPPGGSLYLTPKAAAFRARTAGPRGGQGLFVQGGYQGHLSAWGETVTLSDDTGQSIAKTHFTGVPTPAQQYLRITEIMYHPPPQIGGTNDSRLFEYVELKNISSQKTLDLAGILLEGGISFNFSSGAVPILPPGQTLLLVRDTHAFALRYGAGFNVAGQFSGTLDNAGESLRLWDASGEKILEFAFDPQWHPVTDGLGFSLVAADEYAPAAHWNQQTNWRPSSRLQGSPGRTDPDPPAIPPIRINEVLVHHPAPQESRLELFNPTRSRVAITDWLLTDNLAEPGRLRLRGNCVLEANGFVVLTLSQLQDASGSFRLSAQGGHLYLLSADALGNPTGYLHEFEYDAAPSGTSTGRHTTSQGDEHFVLQSASTLGTANAAPLAGPVVISEILYRTGTNQSDNDEFIELQNISHTNVSLGIGFVAGAQNGTALLAPWRLRHAVDFDFSENTLLKPNEQLLVVGFDPSNAEALANFRKRHAVPQEISVVGPWTGRLNNAEDVVELKCPGQPVMPASETVAPFFTIDKVAYRDAFPWPAAANSQGRSLQRRLASEYGNDPANWFAGPPSAGATNTLSLSLRTPPGNLALTAGGAATFTVAAESGAPLSCQWYFNGESIAGARSTSYTMENLQPIHSGKYTAVISDGTASFTTPMAELSVQIPSPVISGVARADSRLDISAATWQGLYYVLEFKDDLRDEVWTPLPPPVAGSGEILILSDHEAPKTNRFYRVRAR